jgi:hypothetical protein
MRGKGCLLFIVIALLWGGGQGVYVGMKNRQPTSLSCADFYAGRPKSEWLKLTGCRLSYLGATYRERFGDIREVFVPVLPVGERRDKTIRLVLATEDAETIALLKEMKKASEQDQKALFGFLAQNAKRLFVERDVEGTLQTGIDRSEKTMKKLRQAEKDLADDFAVLDEGKKPSLFASLALLGGGLLGGLLLIALAARKTSPA